MKLHCFFEDTIYSKNDYVILYCSTFDESASMVPQRNTYAQKGKYGFKALCNNVFGATGLKKCREYIFYGDWVNDKYGHTFSVVSVEENIRKTEADIVSFLSSIKGVGKRSAQKIYNKFQNDTIEIIRENIDILSEVKVSKKVREAIRSDLETKFRMRKIVDFLSDFSIPKSKIKKIIDIHKEATEEVMRENPYLVAESGAISFVEAESIAKQINSGLSSVRRIEQCVLFIMMSVYKTKGHLFFDRASVEQRVLTFLNENSDDTDKIKPEAITSAIDRLIEVKKLVQNGKVIYLKKDHFAEHKTANLMVDLMHCPYGNKLPENLCLQSIKEAEKEFGFILNSVQKTAICRSMNSNISVITGGPGTGKSTLLKYILKIFKDNFGDNIGLCAPTGKAARRMAECTGVNNASTIHSLLGLDTDYSWSTECHNIRPIPYDLLVIDESSMLDMELAYLLMASIPQTCKVIFLGDVDQLPSVGAGNVLNEMINSGVIPVTKLNQIYRQAEDSLIITNSFNLNKGKTNFKFNDDFLVRGTEKTAVEDIVKYYSALVEKRGMSPDEVQILTPYRSERYSASTYQINKLIQQKINPPNKLKEELTINRITFRDGDRVVQQKNNQEIKNGDVGKIIKISLNKVFGCTTVIIDFGEDRIVEYTEREVLENKLDLAYAVTVHKAQGMEYDVVIMPSIGEHEPMLTRKLVYTAWTRAKKKLLIIGDIKHFVKAAGNTNEAVRNTYFAQRIRAREQRYIEKENKKKRTA